jgi:hypothetical protein
MIWIKILLSVVIFFLVGLICYPAYTTPEYFVYEESDQTQFFGEPYLNCSYEKNFFNQESENKIYINDCEVMNVPKGEPYIKKTNPFVYSVMKNELKIFFIMLIIGLVYAFFPHFKASLINKGFLKED